MPLVFRQYWKTMIMEAAAAVGESRLFLVGCLMRFVRVVALLSIWRTVMVGKSQVSGMTLHALLTYTLLSEICADLLLCRTGLEAAWFSGSITTRFLRPVSLFNQFSAEMLGRAMLSVSLFALPLALASPLLGISLRPASLFGGALFFLSLAAAIGVGLALEYIFVGIGVNAGIHPYAINGMRSAVSVVLSGALIPLKLLPWGIGLWLSWLPFASQASAPLTIFTGTEPVIKPFLLQLVWLIILWPCARWLWRANREKMVSYGG